MRICNPRAPATEPTINYGWLTPDSADDEVCRVVLHEFGHALGCIHEHQNPADGIQWNKDVVYAYYAGPPNLWSNERSTATSSRPRMRDLTVHMQLDPASIMMYPIDRRFTLNRIEVALNTELSVADNDFIRQIYP